MKAQLQRLALVLVAASVSLETPAQTPPPVEAFFSNPPFAGAKLSPDGKHLAAAVATRGGRIQLAVLTVGAWEKAKIVAGFSDADIRRFHWVNDSRLVFDVVDLQSAAAAQTGSGLYAVDIDGGYLRQLIDREWHVVVPHTLVQKRVRPPSSFFFGTLPDAGDQIIIGEYVFDNSWDVKETKLFRLDTRTGIASDLTVGRPDGTWSWLLDYDGVPRYVTAAVKDKERIYRRTATGSWEEIAAFGRYSKEPFRPVSVDYDGSLYVVAPSNGMNALFRYDARNNKVDDEPLVRLKGFDLDGAFEVDRQARRIVGVHYLADAPGTYWFDPALRKAQERIDQLLPATANRISCGHCISSRHLLVFAASDRDPGTYYLFDRTMEKLETIARVRPATDPRAMGLRDLVRIRARDGLEIPTWITLPPGYDKKQRYPAVVLVHGGPWVRGASQLWSNEAQFLATRGYVVIEPEFRGSTGFGFAHFHAGWKQWGLAMQDDLVDAVRWAGERGMVDEKRVCIAGGSYGGYAALMGVLRDADVFQCAASYFGVSDIELMYSITWSDFSADWKRYGMPVLIGDRVADAEQLRRTSPLQLAGSLKRPVLLAHGAADRRVPMDHSLKFLSAAKESKSEVEWIVYDDEAHGWLLDKNRFDFYGRLEKFLDKHIGAGAKRDAEQRAGQ